MQTSIFTLVDNIGVVWSSEFLGWYCLCPESRSAWIGPILTKKLNNCKIYTIIKQVSGSINCWVKPTEFLWKFEWWRKNTDWHRCSFKYIAIKEMHTAQLIRGFQNSTIFQDKATQHHAFHCQTTLLLQTPPRQIWLHNCQTWLTLLTIQSHHLLMFLYDVL